MIVILPFVLPVVPPSFDVNETLPPPVLMALLVTMVPVFPPIKSLLLSPELNTRLSGDSPPPVKPALTVIAPSAFKLSVAP